MQRQQLLQERQQFHMEQLRAAEYRARQTAASQISSEAKSQIGAAMSTGAPNVPVGPGASAPSAQMAQPGMPSQTTTQAPPVPAGPAATTTTESE